MGAEGFTVIRTVIFVCPPGLRGRLCCPPVVTYALTFSQSKLLPWMTYIQYCTAKAGPTSPVTMNVLGVLPSFSTRTWKIRVVLRWADRVTVCPTPVVL